MVKQTSGASVSPNEAASSLRSVNFHVIAEHQLSRHCERSEAISSAYKDCFAPFLPVGRQEGARNDERGCFAICYDENALLVGRIEPRRFLPVLSVRQAGGSLTAVRADRPLLALTSYQ